MTSGRRQVLTNISWLVSDTALRGVVGLLVGAWIARYLGPEGFGTLSYALAIVGILSSIAPLGLNNIVVRDLVRDPQSGAQTLGTAAAVLAASAAVTLVLIEAFILIMRPADSVRALILVLALGVVFRPADVLNYFFQARVESRYYVWASNGGFIIGTVLKILAIQLGLSAFAFASLYTVEAGLVAMGALWFFRRHPVRPAALSASLNRAKRMLKDAWPVIFSALFLSIYMKVDQVMIAHFLGDAEVGQYSAAARISESWLVLAVIVTQTLYPPILKARALGDGSHLVALHRFYAAMFWLAVLVAGSVSLGAGPIIELLFGPSYSDAAAVLRLHAWSGLFVFMITAASRWYLIEGMERSLFVRAFIGAVANIVLNLILIPRQGIVGAAVATLLSYALMTLPFDVATANGRTSARLWIGAILRPLSRPAP